jgi:hypothetical protein
MSKNNYNFISILILIILISFILAIFVFIPAFFLGLKFKINSLLLPLTLLKQILIFALILLIPLFFKNKYIIKIITALLASFYYSFIYFSIAYWRLISGEVNPYFFLDSYNEIIETAINLFTLPILIIILITFLFFYFFYFYLFLILFNLNQQLYQKLKTKKIFNFKYLLFFPLLIPLIPPEQGYLAHQFSIIKEFQEAREYFQPYVPDFTSFNTNSKENIFILQIESTNALALQGDLKLDGKEYSDIYIPKLREISQDGVFFPYFWSHSIQTDRAQENILCGIVNNMGASYSYSPNAMPKNCLPKILKKSGYTTIAFRSDNLEFHNMGTFMKNLGFEEIHYDDIMQPNDKKYTWGYDDCIFYQRAFEYLKNNYADKSKLFVYFEVSSHHVPWQDRPEYKFTHKFDPATNFTEKYLNSALVQDYCVGQFYEKFKNYNNPNTHLFILGDTSWPMGINNDNLFYSQNAFNDNFLTLLTYIPSQNRQNKFYRNKKIPKNKIYGQADLIPTIFELLNHQYYQNSFVFELSKETKNQKHENCYLLTQPYGGGSIAIVKGKDKYIYYILDKKLEYYNLETDFYEQNPEILAKNLEYQDFKDQYFCARYK